jgi:hypothetical protein
MARAIAMMVNDECPISNLPHPKDRIDASARILKAAHALDAHMTSWIDLKNTNNCLHGFVKTLKKISTRFPVKDYADPRISIIFPDPVEEIRARITFCEGMRRLPSPPFHAKKTASAVPPMDETWTDIMNRVTSMCPRDQQRLVACLYKPRRIINREALETGSGHMFMDNNTSYTLTYLMVRHRPDILRESWVHYPKYWNHRSLMLAFQDVAHSDTYDEHVHFLCTSSPKLASCLMSFLRTTGDRSSTSILEGARCRFIHQAYQQGYMSRSSHVQQVHDMCAWGRGESMDYIREHIIAEPDRATFDAIRGLSRGARAKKNPSSTAIQSLFTHLDHDYGRAVATGIERYYSTFIGTCKDSNDLLSWLGQWNTIEDALMHIPEGMHLLGRSAR